METVCPISPAPSNPPGVRQCRAPDPDGISVFAAPGQQPSDAASRRPGGFLGAGIVLAVLALLVPQATLAEEPSCARKGQSRHSISLDGGIIESRFDTRLGAGVESGDLINALLPSIQDSAEAVLRWLADNPKVNTAQLLSSERGMSIISQHYASPVQRQRLAQSLDRGVAEAPINQLAEENRLGPFFQGLSNEQLMALGSLSSSSNNDLRTLAVRLNGVSGGQGDAGQILAELSTRPELLTAFAQESLNSDNEALAGIARAMVSRPEFLPVILAQPSLVEQILANPAGLLLLVGASGMTDLGGDIRWTPEQELEFAINYGYDALSWLTLTAGYRYFSAEKGRRLATPAGFNRDLSLSFAGFSSHSLDLGLEFGCYFDVWRPFLGIGVQYGRRNFRASDPLIGAIRQADWHVAYSYGAGLDVDLSQFVEMRIGYRFTHFPEYTRSSTQSISYSPLGFSAPIELENVNLEFTQSGRTSGFFIYLRFFL